MERNVTDYNCSWTGPCRQLRVPNRLSDLRKKRLKESKTGEEMFSFKNKETEFCASTEELMLNTSKEKVESLNHHIHTLVDYLTDYAKRIGEYKKEIEMHKDIVSTLEAKKLKRESKRKAA